MARDLLAIFDAESESPLRPVCVASLDGSPSFPRGDTVDFVSRFFAPAPAFFALQFTQGLKTMIHVVAVITTACAIRSCRCSTPMFRGQSRGCIEYGAAVDFEDGQSFKLRPDTFRAGEMGQHGRIKAHPPPMAAYGGEGRMIASRVIHILSPA